ncbi:MAG: AMP-binding protein [Alphaproteobacteria bacterium]
MNIDALLARPAREIAAAQDAALRRMLALCEAGHPYYGKRWAEAGIDVSRVSGTAALARLPLTSKADLMADPEAFRLSLPELPLEERALAEVIHTTGSTAEPTPIYNTTHDVLGYMLQARCLAAIAGIGERDIIANLFPLTPAPMGAFQRSGQNASAIGAAIVSTLPGAPFGRFDIQRSLDDGVHLVALHRASILWGVTSYVRRVLLRALEVGADFSSVRMCAVTGEASSPAMRDDLRRLMREAKAAGCTVFDRYGSTELGSLAQCQEDGDWHNPAPDLQFLEAVDPETGARLPDGERGALALTHLDRRGTVLVRFVVGDTVAVERSACPNCGRYGERVIGPVVRTRDLVKVKGMLINPAVLLDALQQVSGVEDFQVEVGKVDGNELAMDEVLLRIASHRPDHEALADELVAATAAVAGVRPRVTFVAASEIYDPTRQTKANRFIDRRSNAYDD